MIACICVTGWFHGIVRGMDETHPRPREYEYTEGKDAARRFEGVVKAVLTAPPVEIRKREKAVRKKNKK